MKNLRFKTGMSLLLALMFAGASVFGQKAEKEISKEYKITKGYTLNIDNKYGAIEVVNWDKSELSVLVKIETEASSEEKAESLLKRVTIDISEEKSAVYFETDIDFKKMVNNNKVKVTYMVKTPAFLNVNLEQKYGYIFIQDISGEANLEIKYGNLDAKMLVREQQDAWNNVDIAYGDGTIEETGALSTEVKYGGLTISKSTELSIESAYSKLYLGEVNILDIESKYGKVNMEQLKGSISVESAYTNVSLGLISADFEMIEAEMSYGNLKGELAPGASFKINAETAYGSISIPDGNYHSDKHGPRHEINGSVGSSSDSEINVSIRYGDLRLR